MQLWHSCFFLCTWSGFRLLNNSMNVQIKPFQNEKGQKNLRYPTEKDCFFVGCLTFFWPFLFWNDFRIEIILYLLSSCSCLKSSCSCILWFCLYSPLVSIVYCHRCLFFQLPLFSIIFIFALYTEKGGKVFHYSNLDDSQLMSFKKK